MATYGKLSVSNDAQIEGFTFPDGQPHVRVQGKRGRVTVRISSPADLLNVCQIADVYPIEELTIVYLMGGRMDRRIEAYCPRTLKVVCDILNALPIKRFRVFGVHSDATLHLLRDSVALWDDAVLVHRAAMLAATKTVPAKSPDARTDDGWSIVLPDVGASKSFFEHLLPVINGGDIISRPPENWNVVLLNKTRDLASGRLSSVKIIEGTPRANCLILDDLCDGGATFTAAGHCLKDAGANWVGLSVLHGIFSRSLPILGINHVFTTNSFCEREPGPDLSVYKVI